MHANTQPQFSPRSTNSTPRNPAELVDQARASLDAIDAGAEDARRALQRYLQHTHDAGVREGSKQGALTGFKAGESYVREKVLPVVRDRALGLGFLLGVGAGIAGAFAVNGIVS